MTVTVHSGILLDRSARMSLFAAICLMVLVPIDVAFSQSKSNDVIVRSVRDFRLLCSAILAEDNSGTKAYIASALCVSYIKGLIDGYVGSLALRAEFDTAEAEGMEHSELLARFEADENLHDKITKRALNMHFLCFPEGESLSAVARKLLAHIDKKYPQADKSSAYYVLVSGLLELYPCG